MIQDKNNLYDVIIIGGGPAGLSAALYLARSCYRVIVLEKEKFGGQITLTSEVVNYPGVPKTDGVALTASMRRQAETFGAEFHICEATSVSLNEDIKEVSTTDGEFRAFSVIIATGATPRRLGFKGEKEFQGHGIAYCATCDGEFFTDKDVFVIGGGFAAAEESVYLTKFAKSVTIIMRGDDFSCAKSIADQAKNNPKIKINTNSVVEEVSGDSLLRKIVYKNIKTGEITTYEASNSDTFGVFSFAGYVPATELFKGIINMNSYGYILSEKNQATNIPGVFAAGDVCDKNLRQIVTAVGDGAVAATALEKYCGAMREKFGVTPQIERKAAHEELKTEAKEDNSTIFGKEIVEQLNSVFDKMENSLVLSLALDNREVSNELKAYITELASLTEKLSVEVDTFEHPVNELPMVRILKSDKTDTGLSFHGVPSGHEFNSFILGLYNAAGSGQKLDEEIADRIKAINNKFDIKVIVSLTCTMCPELVVSAQKIASRNGNVTASIYDVMHFSDLREKYHIMSVPCMIINDGEPIFGKKNIDQLLSLIES
ncbi:MAG: FAD-dependent oxidoreductase [Candidatus Fimenecus sp.]